jgi:hypothetical protein
VNNGSTIIEGTLNSTPGTTFTVQLFSSPQANPSGFGEGKTFIGEKTDVVTDSSGNTSFSFTIASAIPAGEVVSATATDPSGNTSEFSEAVTVLPDTTSPDPPVIAGPPNDSFNNTGDVALSGTAEANTTVEIFDDTTSKGTTPVNSSGAWSKTLTGVPDGTHTYTAKASDAAGNISPASNARTVTVDTKNPRVKRVVPAEYALGVAPGASVYVFFSEQMRADSINSATFRLYKKGATTPVLADVTLDSSNRRKAILDPKTTLPNGHLKRGVTYKAVVSTGAEDAAGNPLAKNKVWFFLVKP